MSPRPTFSGQPPAVSALIAYLVAMPVTVLLSALVPFALQVTGSVALLLLAVPVSAALFWRARDMDVWTQTLYSALPVAFCTAFLGAFTREGLGAALGVAAWSAILALTVPFRRALPLAVSVAQVVAGVLLSLEGVSTLGLLVTCACPLLTVLAPRRSWPGVQAWLRSTATGLAALGVLALMLPSVLS